MLGRKIFAYVMIGMGALAVIGGLSDDDTAAVVGGAAFIGAGVVILDLIRSLPLNQLNRQ